MRTPGGMLFLMSRTPGVRPAASSSTYLWILLLGVGRQLVEADPHVPAVPAPEISDLAGQVQALAVGEGHDDVDRRAHGDPARRSDRRIPPRDRFTV